MKTPIMDSLKIYSKENNTRLHMPGHKGRGRGYEVLSPFLGILDIDVTEVKGTDNLHCPEGAIAESQKYAADIYSADESFYLINGSTSGIYAMISSCVNKGDKIIVQRNCHRSVFMASYIMDLRLSYITPTILEEFNIPVSLDERDVIKAVQDNPDAKAIVITSPTYYGTCPDIETIGRIARKYNMLLLVDGAHGAHFPFCENLPNSSICLGADMEVVSTHKTLPCLTQTAILNIRDRNRVDIDKLRFMLSLYQSTSPSYILMASIEAGLKVMSDDGEKLLSNCNRYISHIRKNIPKSYRVLLENERRASIHSIDPTRLVIKSSLGGCTLSDILRDEYNIQVEMADENNIVIIGSGFDNENDYNRLLYALKDIEGRFTKEKCKRIQGEGFDYSYSGGITIKEGYTLPSKVVLLDDSIGKMCGEMISPYPPGIPVLLPGEVITYNKINSIKKAKDLGIEINGIKDKSVSRIRVLDI